MSVPNRTLGVCGDSKPNRALYDEFRHSPASAPEHAVRRVPPLMLFCVRPRLAPDPMLFCLTRIFFGFGMAVASLGRVSP